MFIAQWTICCALFMPGQGGTILPDQSVPGNAIVSSPITILPGQVQMMATSTSSGTTNASIVVPNSTCLEGMPEIFPCQQRRLFESDKAFENFVGPISNPILSKDPRANTYARFLFINNVIPGQHPLGGGNFQVYAMEVNVALTERLAFIADKDGYATINPGGAASTSGFVNINAGLKYTFWRDVENQRLAAIGFMYEPPTGEAEVFQNHGPGVGTAFLTSGFEIGDKAHVLGTAGYQFPFNKDFNSSFFYSSVHVDKQFFGCLYPLAEVNLFHYTGGGDRGLPPALGEGDGLLNFGTSGVAGNTLVTGAIGLKAILSEHAILGAAWEVPLTNRKDLIDNRLTCEFILRY